MLGLLQISALLSDYAREKREKNASRGDTKKNCTEYIFKLFFSITPLMVLLSDLFYAFLRDDSFFNERPYEILLLVLSSFLNMYLSRYELMEASKNPNFELKYCIVTGALISLLALPATFALSIYGFVLALQSLQVPDLPGYDKFFAYYTIVNTGVSWLMDLSFLLFGCVLCYHCCYHRGETSNKA